MNEKRFTPYPGNKPQNQQEVEDKGRSRSVENKPNKGYKVCKTTVTSTEQQPSTSKMNTGNHCRKKRSKTKPTITCSETTKENR